MRYLITGGSGQLGFDLKRELEKDNMNEVYTPTHNEMDITDKLSVLKFTNEVKPDVIVNCAAYTNVDKAETDFDACFKNNVYSIDNLNLASYYNGAKLIGISSDYVFDGKKDGVYEIDDITHPINMYGKSKEKMEKKLLQYDKSFIVRTSWVFGENGKNFVKTMLNASKTHDEVTVISDQVGSPTYTPDLAKAIIELSKTDYYGIYHATNEGFMSWYDFTKLIYEYAGVDTKVLPILAKDYLGSKTDRPKNSRLSKVSLDDAGINRLPSVEEAVRDYVRILKK